MHLIVQANNAGNKRAPTVGQTWMREEWDDAVSLVVELAGYQCDTPEAEIRAEVEADGDFADPNGEWTIAICKPESEGPGKEAFKKPEPGREVTVTFEAQGSVKQTVLLTDPNIIARKLEKMLRKGEAATTIQEGGTVDVVADGKVLGRVVNVDNNLEYDVFDVEDD